MAIATKKQLVKDTKPELLRPEVLPAPKPIAVDTKYEPRTSLLQFVSGAKWVVTYYKQLKTSEEASEAFNINRPAPYQQYLRIEEFELKVSSTLQWNADSEQQNGTLQGTALIYPSIVPDVGDTFIADIGDGKAGYFNVQEVTQLSHLKDTVYEINFEIIDWLDYETKEALDKKVVKVLHYERSYADYGANPILDEKEHGSFKKLTTWCKHIVSHYFSLFYSNEYDTFLVPVPNKVVYDPFLTEFIQRIWHTDIHPLRQRLYVYNRDNNYSIMVKTVWDVMVEANPLMLMTCHNKFGVIPTRLFKTGLPSLVGITYSRLDFFYHPIVAVDVHQGKYEIPNVGNITATDIYPEYSTTRTLSLPISRLPGIGFVHPTLQQDIGIPDAKRYCQFDTYVFSPAFYNRDKAKMSKVERMVYDMIESKPVNAETLLPILENVVEWGSLEQFYYIPVLYALARVALGDLVQ